MKIDIQKVKPNKNNPRVIKDFKFKKLVQSIQEFPEMLEKRPIVVDEDMIVLGGNMRLKACIEAGLKKINVIIAEGWSEKQKQEFIIKDNVGYGEWDWDVLANEWEKYPLQDWGMDLWDFNKEISFNENVDESLFENDIKESNEVNVLLNMSNKTYEKIQNDIQKIIEKDSSIKCKIQN